MDTKTRYSLVWGRGMVLLLGAILVVDGCSQSTPTHRTIHVLVSRLPDAPEGAALDLTKPLPPVPGAAVRVLGAKTKVTVDDKGTGILKVPLGGVTFRIQPPSDSELKPATYKERILEKGTDTLGFVVSPGGELNIDNSTEKHGSQTAR